VTRRVLVVDDDPTILDSVADALAEDGITVMGAEGGTSALAMLQRAAPDVVLSDVRMPDIDGLTLLREIKAKHPDSDVVMMTAFDDMPTVVASMRGGAVEFLVKPLDLKQLRTAIRRVFDDRRSRSRAARTTEDGSLAAGGLIGRTPAMIAIYKLVGQAAGTRATVLIRGESGTGKELVARAIHANSPNEAEPFVPVNCAALPTTLLESELFGHTRGAFTGAVAARRGRFAMAGTGTIFLDEIGDTSLEFQSKLLRVLQDREFHPVGAERAERTEARVVAATHRDLEAMVAERTFREDLYYRLRVVEIVIPPLRERPADIPLLAGHIVRSASSTLGTATPVLSEEALSRLTQHSWPGNVRELENCLTRAVVLAAGNVVRPEHLSIASPSARALVSAAAVRPLDDIEREHVTRALAVTGGHKTRAAEMLGVSRPRLNRLIEKYGLE
jgi:two-component system response regulator AtoC